MNKIIGEAYDLSLGVYNDVIIQETPGDIYSKVKFEQEVVLKLNPSKNRLTTTCNKNKGK